MSKSKLYTFLVSTFVIVCILFYIDEGYNSFKWVEDIGNWIAFAIYFSAIFTSQFVLYKWLLPLFGLKDKVVISILLGTVFALFVLIYIVFRQAL